VRLAWLLRVQQAVKAARVLANLGAPAEQLLQGDAAVPLQDQHQ
jgi:hypothetical protein